MAAIAGNNFELESLQATSIAMEESGRFSEEEPLGRRPLQDISKMGESKNRREDVMEWMESQYRGLAQAIKTTQTVNSFHLAEENKQEFPHDDAVKVTEEMANKLLNCDEQDENLRKEYLKSMFFCVTPDSLTPLAVVMYQEFEKICTRELAHGTERLQLRMVFQYEDEKKVIQLCICLFVRGLLNKETAEQICRESDNEEVQTTLEGMINKDLKGAPEQLLAASEDVRRSLYSAYCGWREIPLTDAEHITEAMVKHLTGSDEERKAYLASMYFSLKSDRTLLPLVIAMFQKYKEICPDKLELLKGHHNKEWNPKFLGRVLFRRNVLTKEEYDKFKTMLTPEELLDRKKLRRGEFKKHDLEVFFDTVWEEEPYDYDLLDYQGCQLPYDDAVAVSRKMLPLLIGTAVHHREIDLNNLSCWVLGDIEVVESIKTGLPGHDSMIGEYNNVAVLMCQQYMDQFPDFYRELEKHVSPQYIHLFVKSLWQRNVLSEVAISFYIKSISFYQDNSDKRTISHGLPPLLFSLPRTVYMPEMISSDVSDFSTSVWIQSSHYRNFMRILVTAAIKREEQAPFQVLVKSLRNYQFSGYKVELILDIILPDQPQLDSRRDDSVPLYILAAHRGSHFINVAFRLLEYLNKRNSNPSMSSRVIQLIEDDEKADHDHTVANIMNRVIDSEAIVFSDREKAELVESCFQYAGKGSRSRTAVLLWDSYSDHLNFKKLLSDTKNEDVPFAILEEFNIDLYSRNKAEKATNSLHVAAKKGYTKFIGLALEKGFTRLLIYSNEEDQYPVQVALEQEHYGTAAVMLRAMNDYKLCLAESSQDTNSTDGVAAEPKVNFRKRLLDPLKELANMFESSDDDSERADIVHKGEPLKECVVAILDSTVDQDGRMNCYDLLKVYNESTPDNRLNFMCPSIDLIMRHQEYPQFKAIIDHESFQSLVNYKWGIYGQNLFLLYFVTYLFFLVLLTTTFVLGATKAGSPSKYNQPLDWFRLFCEIVLLLLIIVDIMLEIKQFYHTVLMHHNSFRKWTVYFTDRANWFDDLAILMTLLVIPFRIADLDEQWMFVALAYILHCLRVFKYAIIELSFAVYVKTIFKIIERDIAQFFAVFLVVTISFGGGLYFSLRSHPCGLADQMTTDEAQFNFSPVINTSLCQHPDETSQIYLVWLTGLRLLTEGNIIEPYIYGDRGFWWFSAIIYMIFLFLVTVILLNLLIAQLNKSYEENTKKVITIITLERAKILVKLQSAPSWAEFFYVRQKYRLVLRQRRIKLMPASDLYRSRSVSVSYDDENVNDLGNIHKQLLLSTSTDQKQFRELRAQLKEVKVNMGNIAKSTKEQVTTCLREEMNKQAVQQQTVQSDLSSQSEVVKELQSEVRSLAASLREQTELVVEQQRQNKETLKSLEDMLQRALQK